VNSRFGRFFLRKNFAEGLASPKNDLDLEKFLTVSCQQPQAAGDNWHCCAACVVVKT